MPREVCAVWATIRADALSLSLQRDGFGRDTRCIVQHTVARLLDKRQRIGVTGMDTCHPWWSLANGRYPDWRSSVGHLTWVVSHLTGHLSMTPCLAAIH